MPQAYVLITARLQRLEYFSMDSWLVGPCMGLRNGAVQNLFWTTMRSAGPGAIHVSEYILWKSTNQKIIVTNVNVAKRIVDQLLVAGTVTALFITADANFFERFKQYDTSLM